MGFVGLTLAVALANVGFRVNGIDINQHVIDELLSGKVQIHEEGLESALHAAQSKDTSLSAHLKIQAHHKYT